jgi:protoheme IX farnesyltransferase
MPFAIGMSGLVYLGAAISLGGAFLLHALELHREYSDARARATFRYSIFYLAALFTALLADHYLR